MGADEDFVPQPSQHPLLLGADEDFVPQPSQHPLLFSLLIFSYGGADSEQVSRRSNNARQQDWT